LIAIIIIEVDKMTKCLGYRISEELKDNYESFILKKYDGKKHGKCNLEIEKAIKIQLALSGDERYINEIENIKDTLVKMEGQIPITPTHDANSDENNINKKDIREIIKEEIANSKDVKQDSGMYAKPFISDFKDIFSKNKEITEDTLVKYVMSKENVMDPRPIKQRLVKLEAEGLIEKIAPKVYANLNYNPETHNNELKDVKRVTCPIIPEVIVNPSPEIANDELNNVKVVSEDNNTDFKKDYSDDMVYV
jgi:hypothetical protein